MANRDHSTKIFSIVMLLFVANALLVYRMLMLKDTKVFVVYVYSCPLIIYSIGYLLKFVNPTNEYVMLTSTEKFIDFIVPIFLYISFSSFFYLILTIGPFWTLFSVTVVYLIVKE